VAARAWGVNGFVTYVVAPASTAVSRLESSPRVVNTITVALMTPDESQHVDPVHIGHVQVQDDQLHGGNRELLDRFETRARFEEFGGFQ
jgi:hypothetical protein